jgi:hypothetical protein
MAREIRGVAGTGNTLYARVMNRAGLWWNTSTSAFEAYTAANWANYRIAMTEQGSSGVYVADFPSAIQTSGTYYYYVHVQAGGSAAEGDVILNTGTVDWTGSSSISGVASGAMSGSDFRDYIVDEKGFTRDDEDDTIYAAITDAIQIMRRRFEFDEAEVEQRSTDTISVLGDFKLNIETNLGLLLGVILEDGTTAVPLKRISKRKFDRLYADINVTADRGYPEHYCVFAGQVYIGPIPDSTSYYYRKTFSTRGGTVTSSTSGVPFTNLYRDVLADLVLAQIYDALEEFDKSDRYFAKFEAGFKDAVRRERRNAGLDHFQMKSLEL